MSRFSDAIVTYVKESVLKIGDAASGISFNFPPDTLKSLFGDRNMPRRNYEIACQREARSFPYGILTVRHKNGLTVVGIDGEGVKAIAALPITENDRFLKELIRLSADLSVTSNTVHALFASYGDGFFSAPGMDGEFDEVFWFESFDDYCYGVSYESGGIHYHRLLKEDFDALYPDFRAKSGKKIR